MSTKTNKVRSLWKDKYHIIGRSPAELAGIIASNSNHPASICLQILVYKPPASWKPVQNQLRKTKYQSGPRKRELLVQTVLIQTSYVSIRVLLGEAINRYG